MSMGGMQVEGTGGEELATSAKTSLAYPSAADYGSLERSTLSEPSSTLDENRQPSPSPLPGHCVEATWQSHVAECTAATLIKVVASKLIPVALDEHLTTRRAIGRVVFQVVNVADVTCRNPAASACLRARTSVSGGVAETSSILKSRWNAVKCSGTSGPRFFKNQSLSRSISSSESLWPGISRVVTSNQTLVSLLSQRSVSSTGCNSPKQSL